MLHSVRARLTFWYTAILALMLITFSTISYVFLARAIRAATDAALADTARQFAAAFSREQTPSDLRLDFRYSDRDISVLSSNGDVIAASRNRMPAFQRRKIADSVRTGTLGFHTFGRFRVFMLPLEVFGHRYTAVVAASPRRQEQPIRPPPPPGPPPIPP